MKMKLIRTNTKVTDMKVGDLMSSQPGRYYGGRWINTGPRQFRKVVAVEVSTWKNSDEVKYKIVYKPIDMKTGQLGKKDFSNHHPTGFLFTYKVVDEVTHPNQEKE